MGSDGWNVAVAGATGAVGEVMIRILQERNFPVSSLERLTGLVSRKSAVHSLSSTETMANP